jgi:hypothetical protein
MRTQTAQGRSVPENSLHPCPFRAVYPVMAERSRLLNISLAAGIVLMFAAGWWSANPPALPPAGSPAASPARSTPDDLPADNEPHPLTRVIERHALVAAKQLERFRNQLSKEKVRPGEALLTFRDGAAYRRFLARAQEANLRILGHIDAWNTVRVGFDELSALESEVLDLGDDLLDLGANFLVYPPQPPPPEERVLGQLTEVGNGLLPLLGVSGNIDAWGRGVIIAILDSGVAADPTFGQGRLRRFDIGSGLFPDAADGHGTAVASLAAGMSPDAQGIAPAAVILSIRVTAADGLSDAFTLASAIQAAVEQGARVLNISLGAYQESAVLTRAIDFATSRNALIVASAGNDQAAQLTWPAADPRVLSVGAVDGVDQQVFFSNSGEQLRLTAPGFGILTAWTGQQRVLMDGTSASAPVVTGGIAAMMSENPGLSPGDAAALLQRFASDGGAPGRDPAYGYGIINLGWAMNRSDYARIDTAVSSHSFNSRTGNMEFLIQNRSGQAVSGLTLDVSAGTQSFTFPVPWLGVGSTHVVALPVDLDQVRLAGRIDYRTTLSNPPNLRDVIPSNNRRANVISLPSQPK